MFSIKKGCTVKYLKKCSLYFPLIIIDIIIVITLVLFMLGPVEWLTSNSGLVVIYVLAIYLFFSAGYILAVKRQKPVCETYVEFDFFSYVRVLFIFASVIGIVYYVADLAVTYGSNLFDFATHPGASYDFNEHLQNIQINYPTWFHYITRTHTVFYGIILFSLTCGLFYFKRFNTVEKVLWFALLAAYIFRSWMAAAQSYFFMLLFIYVTFFTYKLFIVLNGGEETKKIVRKVAFQVTALLLAGISCAFIMYYFQRDRSIQRDIRTKLHEYIIDKGYEFNEEVYEMTVLHSINIRLGKEIFDVKYDFDANSAQMQNEMENFTSRPSTAKELNMSGIDNYYKIDRTNSILYKINPQLFFGVQSVDIYVTQGYGALGLAFSHDFTWTYFIGNSRLIVNFVDDHFGTDIFERTYVYKNENVYNWSSTTYWQSLYTWLSSDFTFYGVIVFFGLYGLLFAFVWLEIIRYKNPFAFALMFMMIFGIMMASANNLLFQDLGLCIATVSIIIMFVLSLVIRKRKVYKLN